MFHTPQDHVPSTSPKWREARHTAAPAAFQSAALVRHWHREQEICEEEGINGYWYCVISGAVRKCIVQTNGRRRIVDLLLPGDFFGFAERDEHAFTVQAVTDDTILACYSRSRIEQLCDKDPSAAREMRQRAFATISRLQEQLLVVGSMTAIEKVRAFLVHMARRIPEGSEDGIVLPISRYDIADHLGISVETVSRAITELQESGSISLQGPRRFRFVWPAANA
jgi:CRP/FNR family nitrogen fixation transcriptional regulator